jgi:hypothetical protein
METTHPTASTDFSMNRGLTVSCGDDASRIPPEMSSAAVYMYTCSTGIKKAPVRPRLHACTYARLMHVTAIENHRSARGKKKRTKRPSYIEFRKNRWSQFPGAGISRGVGVGALVVGADALGWRKKGLDGQY